MSLEEESPDTPGFVQVHLSLPGGELGLLQPDDAAELPDDGPVEWAPLVPYWSVLWRSGLALARELGPMPLRGRRVLELGCGLGVPSLVAARAGATVLVTDTSPEALTLVERNARANGLRLEIARADWLHPEELVNRGPFDLVLAADVLYEGASLPLLDALLPRLGAEAWLADPGRPLAQEFVDGARARWSVTSHVRDAVDIHRLRARGTAHQAN